MVKTRPEKREEMQIVLQQLEDGVKNVFSSDNYVKFLKMMSNFHNYSVNNCVLILNQFPTATRVASFQTWGKLGCNVKKGSKGIKILVPTPKKFIKEQTTIDDDGNSFTETIEKKVLYFKVGYVFDISQVDGNIPSICEELKDNSELLHSIAEQIILQNDDINYDFELKQDGANGYCCLDTKEIFIRSGMSDLQTIKTILHEKAHQLLHAVGSAEKCSREYAEVQAEACAYVVLQYLQNNTGIRLDTSSYSFPYIATWSTGKDVKELVNSLEVIKNASQELIHWFTSEIDLLVSIPA